jgi:starch synthase
VKVLYIAAECKPFSKVGGVGDVAGELPVALAGQGIDIEIVTPAYGRDVARSRRRLSFQGRREPVRFIDAAIADVPVTLVACPAYFAANYATADHPPLPFPSTELFWQDYGTPYVNSERIAFYDDAMRFSCFSEACLELVRKRQPDVVHVNDWPLGYLFARMAMDGLPPKRVLTVHNVAYQGNLWRGAIRGWELERVATDAVLGPLFADPRPEWESVNLLRLAMELADEVNTVSPHYRDEMLQAEDRSRYVEGGKGLEGVAGRLAAAGRLHGILNGFEYAADPTDEAFDRTLLLKAEMKAALTRHLQNPQAFLVGFVGRAVEQKFRLLAEPLHGKSVLEHILDMPDVNVAIVATGLPEFERFIERFTGRPNFIATLAFDRERARQVSIGADLFLMPSLFEPCGITQMESMSVATPPLVRWTGGLVDTVTPHTDAHGTGFGFDGRTGPEELMNLLLAIREAVRVHATGADQFRAIQRRGFNRRFLWPTAADRYVELYHRALGRTAPR